MTDTTNEFARPMLHIVIAEDKEHLAESIVKKGIKSAMGTARASHA